MNSNDFAYTQSRGEFIHKGILWNAYTTQEILEDIEEFRFLPSDLVINTFPRSGTTLTQEIVWHIKNKDIIKKGEKYGNIDVRFPFLEFNSKFDNPDDIYPIKTLELQINKPYRLIKTHCPFSFIQSNLLAAKPKCIVVVRNPRDVCVSLYHFYRGLELFGPWQGNWNEFVEMFQRGYTKCGSWMKWHKEWWQEIGSPSMGFVPFTTTSKGGLQILFYTFEMLIKDPTLVIQAIADFLDEPLTEDQMNVILHNSNFQQMSVDNDLNFTDTKTGFRFVRKGQIGNWQTQFTEEQLKTFEDAVEKDVMVTGIKFEYE